MKTLYAKVHELMKPLHAYLPQLIATIIGSKGQNTTSREGKGTFYCKIESNIITKATPPMQANVASLPLPEALASGMTSSTTT